MEIKFSQTEVQQMQEVKRYLANAQNDHSPATVKQILESKLSIPAWFKEILNMQQHEQTIVESLENLLRFTPSFGKVILKEITAQLKPICRVYSANSITFSFTNYGVISYLEGDILAKYPSSSYIVKYKLDEDENSLADQLWEVRMSTEESSVSVEIYRFSQELK